MRTNRGVLAGVLLMGFLAAPSANAQTASRLGPSITAISGVVKGSAVGYDPKNSVYLVVSAYGPVNGRFVSAEGVLLGVPFPIKEGSICQFPRVAYSPDANGGLGGFLVTWQQSDGINNVHSRLVSFSHGLIGPEEQLSFDGSFNESGAGVAYSTVSKEFLVTWDGMWRDPATGTLSWRSIVTHRVGGGGNKLGTPILVAKPPPGDYGYRDPSIAYNPDTNEWLVVYSAWVPGSAFVAARRIAPVTGALLGAAQTHLSFAVGTYITEATYNPATKQYLAAWYQGGTYGRLLDGAGNAISGVLLLATRFSAYDALGIDYNPVSGSFMMVSHDSASLQNGAVEVSAAAVPGLGFVATDAPTTKGNYYPKIAARRDKAEWLMSTATTFAATTVQRLQSSATSSGGPSLPIPLSVSLAANTPSPVPHGTAITWTASASGGTAPLQYQFMRYTEGVGWSVAQAYSSNNVYTWFPAVGTHAVQVWVRNAGSTATWDAYQGTGNFLVVPATPKVISFTSSVPLPPVLNVPVTWTAVASGGVGGVQYQFMRFSVVTGWQVAQPYSPINTFTWFPPLGTSIVQVWVRSAGSTANYEDWKSTGLFTVGSSAARIAGLTADKPYPSAPGIPITWTASGTGGAGPLEYKFFRYNQALATWTLLRDWNTSNQATWFPANPGLYAVQVWVRTAGTLVTYEDWKNTEFFGITTSTGLTLTADRALATLRHGELVRWTATVSGGTGPWEYAFFTFNGTSWTLQAPGYSAQNQFDWVVSAGTRAVQVWVRSAGSTAAWERWQGSGLFVVNP